MNAQRILLVEDDAALGSLMQTRLSEEYNLTWVQSISAAQKALVENFDLVILDVGLPDGNGFTIAKELAKRQQLFIFLTAQSEAEDRLLGFELGAEEYIPKPFHLKELLIRVDHVLKKHKPLLIEKIDPCEIHVTEGFIQFKDGRVEFPAQTDMKVLEALITKSPKTLSRDEIIDYVWGKDKNPSHRTIDNIIVRLRSLLSDTQEEYIRSVRGVGYQWCAAILNKIKL